MAREKNVDLCEYELKRIENINRNRDFLKTLGMYLDNHLNMSNRKIRTIMRKLYFGTAFRYLCHETVHFNTSLIHFPCTQLCILLFLV